MHVDVNGTRLWFDVEGASLVPDGAEMRARPIFVLVHGGPGTYDHSYFKPHLAALSEIGQVVYLDLRGHGRSDWGQVEDWSFEACADDIAAFCDTLGIDGPVVLGHSLGGAIVLLYGARHPDHAGVLVTVGGLARFDLTRLVEGFRRVAGDDVAELARRAYAGDGEVAEWERVYAAFGPRVPDADELARRRQNIPLNEAGMDLLRELDVVQELHAIDVPTLVCVGELDPVTPVPASQEIVDAMRAGLVSLEIVPGAGHFPWLDAPDACFGVIRDFVSAHWTAAPRGREVQPSPEGGRERRTG